MLNACKGAAWYLGQDSKQEQPDSTGIAGATRGASGQGQHSIVLSKGGVG